VIYLTFASHGTGGYLSIVSGLLYDATASHHRGGPRATLLVGAVLNAVGYFMLWAAASGYVRLHMVTCVQSVKVTCSFSRDVGKAYVALFVFKAESGQ
jgi:hypothetical protein